MQSQEVPDFENILNFRDVCKFINHDTGTKRLKEGLFFRSARPDAASASDQHLLLNTYKLKTIIDLRTTSEHLQQAQLRLSNPPPTAAPIAPSNNHAADAIKIPGIDYININLNGWPYTLALLHHLPYLQTLKLALLFLTGYRIPAISILGTQVLAPLGLTGLATSSLDHSTAEIASVFAVLSDKSKYPLCVHCTQGKDRTGLIVLLVLLVLGVGGGEAQREYERSEGELEREREERVEEVRQIGLGEEFVGCGRDWVDSVDSYLREKYGGVEEYLEKRCGVGRDVQARVRQILLA